MRNYFSRGGNKTSELSDYQPTDTTASTRLYQRDTTTPDTSNTRATGRGGASACEQAIARRRRRFGSSAAGSQDEVAAAVTPVTTSTAGSYSSRAPYSSTATATTPVRETSPIHRRARTPVVDSDEERDREERMPFYSRYLANKAKSREASPTDDYRASSVRDVGSVSSRDSAYLRKGKFLSKTFYSLFLQTLFFVLRTKSHKSRRTWNRTWTVELASWCCDYTRKSNRRSRLIKSQGKRPF